MVCHRRMAHAWTRRLSLGTLIRLSLVLLCTVVDLAEGRGGRRGSGRRSPRPGKRNDFRLHGGVSWLVLLISINMGALIWKLFLDSQRDTRARKIGLSIAVGLFFVWDIALCLFDVADWWTLQFILPVVLWGNVDFVLRYPVCHELSSPMVLKQVLLLVVRFYATVAGSTGSWFWPTASFLMNGVAVPIMYVTSAPVCETRLVQDKLTRDVIDKDLLLRLMDPEEHRAAYFRCRRWALRSLRHVVREVPVVGEAAGAVSPTLRKFKKRDGREV